MITSDIPTGARTRWFPDFAHFDFQRRMVVWCGNSLLKQIPQLCNAFWHQCIYFQALNSVLTNWNVLYWHFGVFNHFSIYAFIRVFSSKKQTLGAWCGTCSPLWKCWELQAWRLFSPHSLHSYKSLCSVLNWSNLLFVMRQDNVWFKLWRKKSH